MTQSKKLYTTKGWLTRYGLECGYMHAHEIGPIRTVLRLEHGFLHVRQYDFDTGKRLVWETYGPRQLAAARWRYMRAVRQASRKNGRQ